MKPRLRIHCHVLVKTLIRAFKRNAIRMYIGTRPHSVDIRMRLEVHADWKQRSQLAAGTGRPYEGLHPCPDVVGVCNRDQILLAILDPKCHLQSCAVVFRASDSQTLRTYGNLIATSSDGASMLRLSPSLVYLKGGREGHGSICVNLRLAPSLVYLKGLGVNVR